MRFALLNEEIPFYTPIEQIFFNRGIPVKEIEHYKNVSMEDTHSPSLLENIDEGLRLLINHIKLGHRVGILVDCDADGFTSAALLYNYLEHLFPSWAHTHLTHYIHEDKQHGLSDSVDKVIESNVQLVIVPDAGGGDGEYAKRLKEVGIDTLIIDHHHTEVEACAPAVVINNQLGNYPNPTLSGVGVVYKFCQNCDIHLGTKVADSFLDLVAVGCVADLMPLIDFETLYYIRQGLKEVKNPFITAMVKEQNYSITRHGGYDPYAIGFYIAPFINATIRVGTQEEKEMLFQALLDSGGTVLVDSGKRGHKGERVPLAVEACRICGNVKSRQTKVRDENLKIIEQIIEDKNLLNNKIVAVKLPKELGIDKNILGLIANILMDKYQRPVLLLNETEEEVINELTIYSDNTAEFHRGPKKVWAGSARNYQYSEIGDLRRFLNNFPQVLYAQGHASAFGIAILDEFFDSFIEDTNVALKDIDFSPMYRVDTIFKENDDAEYILQIHGLTPFYGTGFEEPYVAVEEVHVNSSNLQMLGKGKNPTLKITMPNGAELIKFKATEEEYNAMLDTVIDVVGKCDANTWAGRTTPQIKVEAYNIKRMDF